MTDPDKSKVFCKGSQELHSLMQNFIQEREWSEQEILAFLTPMWIGQMLISGFSEEIFDKALLRMKSSWLEHPLNPLNEK